MAFFDSFQNLFQNILHGTPLDQGEKIKGKEVKDLSTLDQRIQDSSYSSLFQKKEIKTPEDMSYAVKQLSSSELKELSKMAQESLSYLKTMSSKDVALEKHHLEGMQIAEKVLSAVSAEKQARSEDKGKALFKLVRLGKELDIPLGPIIQRTIGSGKGTKAFKIELAREIFGKVSDAIQNNEKTLDGKHGKIDLEKILGQLSKELGSEMKETGRMVWEKKYEKLLENLFSSQETLNAMGTESKWSGYQDAARTAMESPLFAWVSNEDKQLLAYFNPKQEISQGTQETLKFSQASQTAKRMGVNLKDVASSTTKSCLTQAQKGEKPSLKTTFERKLAKKNARRA